MPFFRKIPVIIEAHQVPPEGEICPESLLEFLSDSERFIEICGDSSLFINTLEGRMEAKPGDYIIKGIKGEYYPCKQDIFKETYQEIPETFG